MRTRSRRKTPPNLRKQLKAVPNWESGYPTDFELFHYIPVTGSYEPFSEPERRLERHLHYKFDSKRIHRPRELFRLDFDDLVYIKSIKEYRNDELVFQS